MIEQPEIAALLTQAPETADLDTLLADLFKCYRPRLYGGLRWRMRQMPQRLASRVDPSDVLQDAFLAARRQFPRYLRQICVPVIVWLRRVVDNQLKNKLRFHRAKRRDLRKEQALSNDDWDRLSEKLAGLRDRPDQGLTREERKQQIRLALHQLPAKYQAVIVLRFFEGKSNHEVALHFCMKHDSAATNLLGRALRRLRHLIEGPDGEEDAP